jgi:hypothetical protein
LATPRDLLLPRKTRAGADTNASMSEPALHLLDATPGRAIDLDAATRAAGDLLLALGADLDDEGLRETPRRIAEVYAELLTPREFAPTTFPNDEGSGTCRASGSSGCPSSRGCWTSSRATCRSRSA